MRTSPAWTEETEPPLAVDDSVDHSDLARPATVSYRLHLAPIHPPLNK